jgi:hypothetical protein
MFPFYLTGIGPAEDFLPGWRVYQGAEIPAPEVGYNPSIFGLPEWGVIYGASLYSKDFVALADPQLPIDGEYGFALAGLPFTKPLAIEQSGEVPEGTKYLSLPVVEPIQAFFAPTVNGHALNRAFTSTGRWFWDVSEYAGQEVTLRLNLSEFGIPQPSGRSAFIDSIEFVVPEPGTWALLLAGAMILSPAIRRTTSARQRRRPTANHRGSR